MTRFHTTEFDFYPEHAFRPRPGGGMTLEGGKGMQTTGAGAGFGSAAQMAANQGLAGLNSGYGQAGGMAGQMASNAASMWGAQANYHANMQSGDTFGGVLGGLGGAAAGLAKLGVFSDRRLKADVQRIGVDERTGRQPWAPPCAASHPS